MQARKKIDTTSQMMIPSSTKAIEELAVTLILKECNNIRRNNDCNNNEYLSYVEWDKEGYVIALVDLGLKFNDNSNNKRCQQQQHQKYDGDDDDDDDTPHYWDMPPFIGRLSRLTKLSVYYCSSLPREICLLCDTLKELAFHFCDELVNHSLPMEVGYLTNLIDFRIHSGNNNYEDQSPRTILPIPIMNLPNLRYIYYRGQKPTMMGVANMDINNNYDHNFCLADDLQISQIQFKESLEILEIEYGNLTERTVSKILSHDFLIEYPKLSRIVLPNNNIKSLTSILEKTQPPSRSHLQQPSNSKNHNSRTALVQVLPPTIRLRCLNLLGNPVLSIQGRDRQGMDNDTKTIADVQHNQWNDDDSQNIQQQQQEQQQQQQQQQHQNRERKNLLQFLSLHAEITSLGHGITESPLCTTEILLALDLNDGGRVLLSKGRFNNPIPLSVWPVVLERANNRRGYYSNTNIIYYLLRNGPVLGINSKLNTTRTIEQHEQQQAIVMTPTSTTTKFDAVVVTPSTPSSTIVASSSSCQGQHPGKQQHISSYHNNTINSTTPTTSSPTAIMSMEATLTSTKKRKAEALSQDETVDSSNGALLRQYNFSLTS